jgi:hypothetical protein
MISVHVGDDAGRSLGPRVPGSVFAVVGRDPAHHAKATDVIQNQWAGAERS